MQRSLSLEFSKPSPDSSLERKVIEAVLPDSEACRKRIEQNQLQRLATRSDNFGLSAIFFWCNVPLRHFLFCCLICDDSRPKITVSRTLQNESCWLSWLSKKSESHHQSAAPHQGSVSAISSALHQLLRQPMSCEQCQATQCYGKKV